MNTISLPKKSKVSTLTFDIVYEENPQFSDGDYCFGFCDGSEEKIVLDKNLKKGTLQFYLLHEILEQMNMTYDIDLTHPQITQLGAYLTEYFKENKDVIKYLLS